MLDKVKAANNLRKMQSQIKKQLREIYHSEVRGDSSLVVRGDKTVEKVVIDGQERKDLKNLINDAMKKIDKKSEKQMKGQSAELMEMFGL
jgi:DNA-binding protein YbaB